MDDRSLKSGLSSLGKALGRLDDIKIKQFEAAQEENGFATGDMTEENSSEAPMELIEEVVTFKQVPVLSPSHVKGAEAKNLGRTSVTKAKIMEAMRKPEDHILSLKSKGKADIVYRGRVAYKLPIYIDKVRARM